MKNSFSLPQCFLLLVPALILIGCNSQPGDAAMQHHHDTETMMTHDSLTNFGKMYLAAWTSKNPQDLANCFTEDGVLNDGEGKSAVGRDSIAYVSKLFHDEIPDLVSSLDSIASTGNGIKVYWTITGTNTRNIPIKMMGTDFLEMRDGLISKCQGSYTDEQYMKIVEEAEKNQN